MKYYLITYEYYQSGKRGKITTTEKGSVIEIVNRLKNTNWLQLTSLTFAIEISEEEFKQGVTK